MSAPLSTRDNNGSDFMTMTAPQPKQTIASMLSYRPSFGAPSAGRLIRLSANEGALGCSPKALEALQKSAIDPSRYPEIQDHQLNEAIAERYNLDAGRILTSNGSDELISLLTLAYLEPGDEVVMSEYAFLVIPQATQIAGGVSVKAADIDMTVSVDNLLATVTERTKIVFLVNDGLFEHFLIDKVRGNVEIRGIENIQIPFRTHGNVLFRTCYRMYSYVKFNPFSFFYQKY